MNLKPVLAVSLLVLLSTHPLSGSAVCFYPGSGKSGYRVPLETEVRTAEAIVTGRVLSVRHFQEDADDPDGVTASNVTIRVLKKLKGNVPSVIVVRNENTSSRYPMSVGEEHVLFLSDTNGERSINSCGNSEAMPPGDQLVKRIRT